MPLPFLFFPPVFYFLHGFLPLNSRSPHSWVIRSVPLSTICTPGTPLNAFHSAVSWPPVLSQTGTPFGTCTNTDLGLSFQVGMPSATPCKVVSPLGPTPFFDTQTLLCIAVCLRTWALTLSRSDLSQCGQFLQLLLEPEVLAIEPNITKRHTLTYLTSWSTM